jgi:CAAX protease family protein
MSEPDDHSEEQARELSALHNMFIGQNGIRAGWRLLIYMALLFVLFGAIAPLARRTFGHMQDGFSARNVILSECITFAVILVATLIMGVVEHRPLSDYGLPLQRCPAKLFWTGALWGFVMLSVIIVLMAATHTYSITGLALSPAKALKYALLWAVAFLMVGLFEEFSFRGYTLYTLASGIRFWPAAVITCLLFAGAHMTNPGENWVGVLEIVLIAFFLCMALRRTGNLWFAIGWHMAFDWGESFFYSTPNSGIQATGHLLNVSLHGSKWLSGGSVGPEASVFDVLVTVAGIVLLTMVYPEAKYPSVPPLPVLSGEGAQSSEITAPSA